VCVVHICTFSQLRRKKRAKAHDHMLLKKRKSLPLNYSFFFSFETYAHRLDRFSNVSVDDEEFVV
jgi:hypothetical protein